MSERVHSSSVTCPVARAIDVIGDRWSLLILRDALDGVRRFGDFQRSLGVAKNILSDRLRRLVEAEVLVLAPASDGSPYQEYTLSSTGAQLFPVVTAIRQWGEKNLFDRGEPYTRLLDTRTGKPVPVMKPLASDGSVLSADNTAIRRPG
ncbi:MAG: putative HTH-type transcriptional regulator [Luteibacter sp.]|uniref:winged helix-turn-helix transcriptional regulator n=1 Tax=Luteibacter sp. TaxID=1886636 RepID=UPI001382F00F|nr:helix-turn-helix domain-containing protein [Luteibacter sp.]KAF1007309.1 MAG: putative HTH-type transcriptional regulator [Luteibacter sp.]